MHLHHTITTTTNKIIDIICTVSRPYISKTFVFAMVFGDYQPKLVKSNVKVLDEVPVPTDGIAPAYVLNLVLGFETF